MNMFLTLTTLFLISATASAKDYQVTGTVIELTDSKIVLDKKGEKFEIAKSSAVKTTGTIAVGGKVTVFYSMTASEIEAKDVAKETKKKK
ncbi:MAG: hypothetical protein WA160_03585 [Pseudobdellovibrio sp.]